LYISILVFNIRCDTSLFFLTDTWRIIHTDDLFNAFRLLAAHFMLINRLVVFLNGNSLSRLGNQLLAAFSCHYFFC